MEYRFRAFFVALLAMILLYPSLHGPGGQPVLANLLLTAMYLAAMYVMLGEHRHRGPKALLATPAAVSAWVGQAIPGGPSVGAVAFFHAASFAFHITMLFVILRTVYRDRRVRVDTVFAALCGYIILGVIFGHAYSILHAVRPDAFQFSGGPLGADDHLALTYFSFVTLSTVGYGDVTPASQFARSLAVVEAILGQTYLAVLMADLIGKRMAGAEPDKP